MHGNKGFWCGWRSLKRCVRRVVPRPASVVLPGRKSRLAPMVADGAIAFMRHQPCIGLVPFVIGLHPDFCSETSRRARKLILWRHPYHVAQMLTGRLIKLSQSHMFRASHCSYDAETTLSSQTVTKKYSSIKLRAARDLCIGSFLLSLRRRRDRTCLGSERRAS